MSISSRITAMEGHITNAYEGLEDIGADLTNIDKNINNIKTVLDNIWNDLPKVTATDVTEATLNGTKKGRMNIDVKGNTYQKQLTGKNLLNPSYSISNTTFDTSTNVFTFNIAGRYDNLANRNTILKDAEANTNYKLVLDITENTASLAITINQTNTIFYGSGNKTINAGETGLKVFELTTIADLSNANYDLWISHSNTITGTFKCKMMLIKATETNTDFEPYCGGIPSPNPNFPQTIHNVSGNNNIKIENKNLFDGTYSEQGSFLINNGNVGSQSNFNISNFIEVKPNTEYVLSASLGSGTLGGAAALCEYDEENVFIKGLAYNSAKVFAFTTSANTKKIKISYRTDASNYQLELGSIPTTYVAHQEQNLPFTLAEGQKIYKDSTLQDDGIHQVRGEVVFDGSRTWHLTTVGNSYCFWIRSNTVNNCLYKKHYKDCNYFTYSNETYQNAPTPSLCENDIEDSYSCMFLFKTDGSQGTTVKAWQQYLQNLYNNGTPLRVIYQLREEEIIPYSETQQSQYDAIKQAKSYDDQTNISQTNDDLLFILDITALKK